MKTTSNRISAFDQGRQAASEFGDASIANPFDEGSPEHNNFEVGRRFGVKNPVSSLRLRPSPQAVTAKAAS